MKTFLNKFILKTKFHPKFICIFSLIKLSCIVLSFKSDFRQLAMRDITRLNYIHWISNDQIKWFSKISKNTITVYLIFLIELCQAFLCCYEIFTHQFDRKKTVVCIQGLTGRFVFVFVTPWILIIFLQIYDNLTSA